jgi:uncharacterized membrane protein YuzA (DUF378 family)
MLRKILFVGLGALALLSVAASAPINATAAGIAATILVVAPFALPLILKAVPWVKTQMLLFTYAISVVVVLIAALSAGLFTVDNFNSVPAILGIGTAMFGAVQLVYKLLKNSGQFQLAGKTVTLSKLVTE